MMIEKKPMLDKNNKPMILSLSAWTLYCDALGVDFASLPDYYELGKKGTDSDIQQLRKNFVYPGVVTNTIIGEFNKGCIVKQSKSLTDEGHRAIMHASVKIPSAKIGHHLLSPTGKCISRETRIPYKPFKDMQERRMNGEPFLLEDVLSDENGLEYGQALFNTSDSAKEMMRTLQRLSGRRKSHIQINLNLPIDTDPIWHQPKQYAVLLAYVKNDFRIADNGSGMVDYGRAYLLTSSSKAAEKRRTSFNLRKLLYEDNDRIKEMLNLH